MKPLIGRRAPPPEEALVEEVVGLGAQVLGVVAELLDEGVLVERHAPDELLLGEVEAAAAAVLVRGARARAVLGRRRRAVAVAVVLRLPVDLVVPFLFAGVSRGRSPRDRRKDAGARTC